MTEECEARVNGRAAHLIVIPLPKSMGSRRKYCSPTILTLKRLVTGLDAGWCI